MTRSPKLSATLVLALTAVAVTAFAYTTSETSKTQTAANDAAPPVTVNVDEHAMAPVADEHPVATTNETPAPVTTGNPAVVPDIEHYSLPPVTVTAPRPSEDELLRNAVVDRLAADARLSGKIGVESYRHVVSLTGRVTTTGQAERAEAIARSVEGVRDVNNYLTARVGQI